MAANIDDFRDYNPSHRQVATFFLGFVFISSIHFSIHIPFSILTRLRDLLLGRRPSPLDSPVDEKVNTWLASSASSDSSFPPRPITNNLALGLTLCFAMASVAEFGSLLVFEDRGGLAGCAFLVAWSGMAGQSAKLLGLLKLSLDLKKMGVKRWETYAFWAWLFVALIVMFVSNAISVGRIIPIRRFGDGDDAICVRERHVAVSVLSTALDVILEIYCIIRLSYLVMPAFLSPRHKLEAFLDVRVFRALTLLMLDTAIAAPSAVYFGVLADALPYSIVSLLVLLAFNLRSPEITVASTASIPPTRAGSHRSRSTIEITKMPSSRSLRQQSRVSHPFAASALQDPSPETEDWPASAVAATLAVPEAVLSPGSRRSKQRRRSSLYSESDSDIARSVKGAVVGFAFRDVVGNGQGQRHGKGKQPEKSFLPPMPTRTARAELIIPPAASRSVGLPSPQIEGVETAPSTPSGNSSLSANISSRPSLAISMPDPSRNASVNTTSASVSSGASTKSSLRLTPSTHAPPSYLPSRRTSSSVESEYPAESRRTSGVSNTNSSGASLMPVPVILLPPADDDLSIVYEASHEDSDSIGLPPSRAARPTTFGRDAFVSMDGPSVPAEGVFGEDMFIEGGIGRHIPTPPGVPEDVVERHGAGSGSSGST